jgi:malate permease and related proteins
MTELADLWRLYLPLIGWVGGGWVLGRSVPATVFDRLGKFLFWIGVPISIVAFLRQANLSTGIWIAPAVAWGAMLLGVGLAWLWVTLQFQWQPASDALIRSHPFQGSFLLSAMIGNTGYLGFPVTLAVAGPEYFGWAVFYDSLGTVLGAYGLGVVLAAYFGQQSARLRTILLALVQNPALWSFWIGLSLRSVQFPAGVELGLKVIAWTIVALSLLLLGMRLSQLQTWQNLTQSAVSLSIKMVLVPLLVGLSLSYFGLSGIPRLTLVLQASMPPAFATLVLTEAYDLDRGLTVTSLALGSLLLLALLPVWLLLFAPA